MPWRGPEVPKEFPTLGNEIADWIEARCAIPDREFVGDPYLLTDEQLRFLQHLYRLNLRSGEFVHHRGAQLVRPQKWGKGPLAAAIICAEAQGPVRFSHWDENGEPVGKPIPTPLIQVTAVSEDQTDNIYSALLPMIELGALHGEIEDTGLGRINLPGGGKIEPVTASGRSRLGQRVTFVVQDQTESWLESNGGRHLADTQRRNIGGMQGRWLETCNAWDPAEESVAQQTAEDPNEQEGVYRDDVEAPESLSIKNKAERRRMLRVVYGDSITGMRGGQKGAIKPWINPDSIEAQIIALLGRDPAQAERFFGNRKRAAESAAFNAALFEESADPLHEVPQAELVTIGIDGARFVDGLGMVGTEVGSGFQWSLGIWERPEHASEGYEHPFEEVDGALTEAFERYDVWRVYVDPQWIESWVDTWQGRWGEKRVVIWRTNRPRPIAWAVRNFAEAIVAGNVPNDGDADLIRHVRNSRKRKLSIRDDRGHVMHTIAKDRDDSAHRMDGGMAATLSWEARGDCIAAGGSGTPTREAIFI